MKYKMNSDHKHITYLQYIATTDHSILGNIATVFLAMQSLPNKPDQSVH